MELTKQHKALLAVVGLGVVIVAGDRLFLAGSVSGPASAEAAPAPREQSRDDQPQDMAVTGSMIADRLSAAAVKLEGQSLDTDALNAVFGTQASAPGTASAIAAEDEPDRVKTAHKYEHLKVGLVMLNPRPMASINGVRLEVDGQARIGEGPQRHLVKLLEVKGPDRKTGELGSVKVLVDGVDTVELVIER